jgi:hypothetical protein
VGGLIGKGATSEAAAWHDCSLGVIMNGAGAPAHNVTPGPKAGPWLVELSLARLADRKTRKLQKRRACGVHGGGVEGLRLACASDFSHSLESLCTFWEPPVTSFTLS